MTVLRDENTKQIELMVLLATATLNKVAKNNGDIRPPSSDTGLKNLTLSILNGFYKTALTMSLSKNPNTKGLIVNKPNSWLNLIDLSNFNSNMTKFNILPVSSEILDSINGRVNNEVELYRNTLRNKINRSIEIINNYKNQIQPSKSITDLFSIEVVKRFSTLQLLLEKDLLSYDATSIIELDETMSGFLDLKMEILNMENFDQDPELGVSISEDMKDTDKNLFKERIEDALEDNIISNIKNFTIKDINILIYLVSKLSVLIKERTKGTSTYEITNSLLKVCADKLEALNKLYELAVRTGRLINNFNNTDGITTLTLIGETYDKYQETKKGLKPLIGAYLSDLVQNKDIKNVDMSVNITLTTVIENADRFTNLADDYNKTLIMTRQNNDINKLRTYYIFGLFDETGDVFEQADIEEAKKKLYTLNLSELNNVEETVLNFYKEYALRDTNFKTFIDATLESKNILGKKVDPKMLAGYAVLKLITIYLASQTALV